MILWSFTTVKDEEDIIESFIRYHMNIVDGMVISDNCSNDKTLEILKKLKKEGYNIDIIEDKQIYFDQVTKRKELLEYTIKKYDPDYIFPLDADEFIASNTNDNPRKIIEKLDMKYLYLYKMENYFLNGKEDNSSLFIPERITMKRFNKEEYTGNFKCFVSKNIYSQNINFIMGAHDITMEEKEKIPEKKYLTDLFLAHYPIRSREQLMNKVIIGRLNNMSIHSREEGYGVHQYQVFDEIVKNGSISDKMLLEFSKYYGVTDKKQITGEINKSINYKFCNNIEIKYTNIIKNNDILSNALKNAESSLDKVRNDNNKLKEKRNDNEQLIEKLQNERDYYYEQFNNVINSKWWKLKDSIFGIRKKFNIKNLLLKDVNNNNFLWIMPKSYTHKVVYENKIGKKLDLKNPINFNEKMQYLMVYKYGKKEGKFSDKLLVKELIKKKRIPDLYLPKTLKVYKNVNDINLDELPNNFVLKCNHASGNVIICNDKANFNLEEVKKILKKTKKTNFGKFLYEYHYKYIKPTIFAEEYLEEKNHKNPIDYKIYCANGKAKSILVCSERETNLRLDEFDLDWNNLNYTKEEYRSNKIIEKPKNLSKMIKIAERLSKEFPFVRVDLYEIKNKIYFGEFTFAPAAGLCAYYDDESLLKHGEYIDLNLYKKKKNKKKKNKS